MIIVFRGLFDTIKSKRQFEKTLILHLNKILTEKPALSINN
jgi:hypothetical protein